MDKGLTVPKWVLINRPKIPQMPQNLSAQIVYPSTKVWAFDEKRLHWASIVGAVYAYYFASTGAMKLHSFGFNNW